MLLSPPRLLSPKRPLQFLFHQKLKFSSKNLRLSAKMEPESSTTLVLCGKSNEEKELALSLKTNNTLKLPDGSPVTVSLHSETANRESVINDNVFRINSYMNFLSTSRFGRLLVYSPRLASTHDVVTTNFGELPCGSVCVADVQFKGRGRSKNVWESPKGCLMFSFTMQMEDGRVVPFVQYVVSLAMTEAINDVCQRDGMPLLNVRIKWPNDLYLDGLKVGGVLCTSTYRSKKFNVSAGIGLNINNEKPTTSLNAALQKLGCASNQLQREDIIAAFFNKFESFYDIFLHQGFQELEEVYYKTWLHSGQRVIVQEKSESEDQISENVVTIQNPLYKLPNGDPFSFEITQIGNCFKQHTLGSQGLTPSGYLLAVTEDGQTCELHPDGNSFDFFKGLVRRKLA